MKVIACVAARLSGARHLFFVGAVLAAIGTSLMASSALLKPNSRSAPESNLAAAPKVYYRDYPGLATELECLERGAISCHARFTETSSLQRVAKKIGVSVRILRKLNPHSSNRISAGSSLTIPACKVWVPAACSHSAERDRR
jgi:hypothetical protein